MVINFLSYESSYARQKYCEYDLANVLTSAVTKFHKTIGG